MVPAMLPFLLVTKALLVCAPHPAGLEPGWQEGIQVYGVDLPRLWKGILLVYQDAFSQPIRNLTARGTSWCMASPLLHQAALQGTHHTEPQTTGMSHMTKTEGDEAISRQGMKHPIPSTEQDENFTGPHRRQADVL